MLQIKHISQCMQKNIHIFFSLLINNDSMYSSTPLETYFYESKLNELKKKPTVLFDTKLIAVMQKPILLTES